MSKEKQIEELANEINAMDEPNAHYYGRNLKEHEAFADCFTIAKHLYNAGYRKQSEGKLKKVSDKYPRYVCTACNHLFNNKEYKYCPNCGAKMKGGAE